MRPVLIRNMAMWGGVAVMAACAIRPRPLTESDRSKGTIITAEEIAKSGAQTVWDALRLTVNFAQFDESGTGVPRGIRRRGASSVELIDQMLIVMDNVRIVDIRILEEIPARNIEEIRILSGIDATTYYGTNAGDGVIIITTKTSG
ncbi:MAG: TonB-dependent receptor plug domain-containing protein [Gemmatimonadota bacterium]